MAYNEPQQGHEHGEHGHSKYLHHHFESLQQQFDSDKLGMWLFLVTEILMFGGLFCAYSVYRANHPEIFIYAHQFLDKTLGGINTVVLITSSFTMAWAVRAAQLNQRKLLVTLLALTLCGGVGFMCIKAVEYNQKWKHGLLWGKYYVSPSEHEEHGADGEEGAAEAPAEPAPPAESTEGGSSAGLTAETQTEEAGAGEGHVADANAPPAESAAAAAEPAPPAEESAAPVQAAEQTGLAIEPSKIALAAEGPTGLAPAAVPAAAHGAGPHGDEPRNVRTFFAIYFAMTGLHALHVLAGMVVITIMLILSVKGRFNSEYYTPIDLTGLFWHLVDLIWIFLFPLLYLIH